MKTDGRGVIGLGQTTKSMFLQDGVYSMWNRDAPPLASTANPQQAGKNSYGTFPFAICRNGTDSWQGFLMHQSAAADWWVYNNMTDNSTYFNVTATSGYGQITIFFGNSPEEVIVKS